MMPTIQSLRDLLRLVYLHKVVARNTALGVLIAIALGVILLPPRYVSQARLLVKPSKDSMAAPVELQGRTLVSGQPTAQRDAVQDEISLLKQEKFALEVASVLLQHERERDQALEASSPMRYRLKQVVAWCGAQLNALLSSVGLVDKLTPQTRLANRLLDTFKVERESGSAILNLTLPSRDPALAQSGLQHWLQLYLDERLALAGTLKVKQFFHNQLNTSTLRLTELEQQIREIQQKIGALELSDADRSMQARMDELLKQEDQLLVRLDGAGARKGVAQQQLGQLPAEVVSQRTMVSNPNVQRIRDDILATQIKREEMLRIYKPDTPQIRLLNKAIEEKEKWVASEVEKRFQQENLSPNAAYSNLAEQVREQQLNASEIQARLHTTQKLLKALIGQRSDLLELGMERRRLERDWKNEQDNHQKAQTAFNQAQMEYALEQQLISNVAVVQAADLPAQRSFPKPLQLLALMPFLALAAALLAVWIAAATDKRPNDGPALARKLGLTLLAQLPLRGNGEGNYADEHYQREMRLLWAQLRLAQSPDNSRVIALTSWQADPQVEQIARDLCALTTAAGSLARLQADNAPQAQGPEIIFAPLADLRSYPHHLAPLRQAAQVLLVVNAQQDLIQTCEFTTQLLQRSGIEVGGLVLSRRPLALPETLYRALS